MHQVSPVAGHEVLLGLGKNCNETVSLWSRRNTIEVYEPRLESVKMSSYTKVASRVAGILVKAAIAAYFPPEASEPQMVIAIKRLRIDLFHI